jgi:hypothetical protein
LKAQALADQRPMAPAESGSPGSLSAGLPQAQEAASGSSSTEPLLVAGATPAGKRPALSSQVAATAAAIETLSIDSSSAAADLPTHSQATVDDDLLELLSSGK